MINNTGVRILMGALMLAFFVGAAHADFSIPESVGQLVGLAGLSGENQGAAMDGGDASDAGDLTDAPADLDAP